MLQELKFIIIHPPVGLVNAKRWWECSKRLAKIVHWSALIGRSTQRSLGRGCGAVGPGLSRKVSHVLAQATVIEGKGWCATEHLSDGWYTHYLPKHHLIDVFKLRLIVSTLHPNKYALHSLSCSQHDPLWIATNSKWHRDSVDSGSGVWRSVLRRTLYELYHTPPPYRQSKSCRR